MSEKDPHAKANIKAALKAIENEWAQFSEVIDLAKEALASESFLLGQLEHKVKIRPDEVNGRRSKNRRYQQQLETMSRHLKEHIERQRIAFEREARRELSADDLEELGIEPTK